MKKIILSLWKWLGGIAPENVERSNGNMPFKDKKAAHVTILSGFILHCSPEIISSFSNYYLIFPELWRGAGAAIFSTGIVLFILQGRLISKEIGDFFVSAFTSREYLSNLDEKCRNRILRSILEINFCGHHDDLIARHMSLLGKRPVYIKKLTLNYKISEQSGRLVKRISEQTTYVTNELNFDPWQFIAREKINREVCFETNDAERHVDLVEVYHNGKLLISANSLDAAEIIKETKTDQNYPLIVGINWDGVKAKANCPACPTESGDGGAKLNTLTVIVNERRVTSWASSTVWMTFERVTQGVSVSAELDGLPNKFLIAKLFGNGIEGKLIHGERSRDRVSFAFDNWLLPGNGFCVAIVDKGIPPVALPARVDGAELAEARA